MEKSKYIKVSLHELITTFIKWKYDVPEWAYDYMASDDMGYDLKDYTEIEIEFKWSDADVQ